MRPNLVLQFQTFLEDSADAQIFPNSINVIHDICLLDIINEQIPFQYLVSVSIA